jgi:hypothetical protein
LLLVAVQNPQRKQLLRRKLLWLKPPRLMLLPWTQPLHPLMPRPTLRPPQPTLLLLQLMPLLPQPMLLSPPRLKPRLSKAASKSAFSVDGVWKGRPDKAAFLLIGRNLR